MLKKTAFYFATIILNFIAFTAYAAQPLSMHWPAGGGTNIRLDPGFTKIESSGIVYDPSTYKLYVVDDGGYVISMNTDGSNRKYVKIKGKPDLEAVATTGTGSGYIYVAVEREASCVISAIGFLCGKKKEQMWQLYESTLQPTGRKWIFNMPTDDTLGMEGLTWVPNGSHPYGNRSSGGVFYASSQFNGRVYIYDVDLTAWPGSSKPTLNPIGSFKPSTETTINDLYFDPSQKILYVLYNGANQLLEIDISTTYYRKLATYGLPEYPKNQEGVTLIPGCASGTGDTRIYLSDDTKKKGVTWFNGFPVNCTGAPNNATLISQSIPLSMTYGSTYSISITLKNTGETVWSDSAGYQLGFRRFSHYSSSPGWVTSQSLNAGERIAPGQQKTFRFKVTPTSETRRYHLQWRMQQGSEWFGHMTQDNLVYVSGFYTEPPICNVPPCAILP
ncbi:MAG TPA: hypothetical protein ENJ08_09520 [Gammaproteobacteria bacterium]|nr:hypothetical protein [Gammaproteobacteria bacterium]